MLLEKIVARIDRERGIIEFIDIVKPVAISTKFKIIIKDGMRLIVRRKS
jgi:hypothetical protein